MKQVEFLNVLLEKTKKNDIKWSIDKHDLTYIETTMFIMNNDRLSTYVITIPLSNNRNPHEMIIEKDGHPYIIQIEHNPRNEEIERIIHALQLNAISYIFDKEEKKLYSEIFKNYHNK